MSTWNMPPGVTTNDIPGNGPDEIDEGLTVGDYFIRHSFDGDYWIEHKSGEGMQVFKDNFEKLIADYYRSEF